MAEHSAVVSKRRRIPAIWFVPIVAGLLGIYMVVYTVATEGPTVEVTFETAEGIEAGKTKVKSLSVQVGLVEEVHINDDLVSVTVVMKLDPKAELLLRDDTRFWVVRPRLGAGGISGLGTIMSGAYIELQPGPSAPSKKLEYTGLENIPITALDAPGLWLTLVGSEASSIGVGQPVLFRGYPVGRVEERTFDAKRQKLRYSIFIEEPYEMLVDRATRFWNMSGISLSASADGVKVAVGSLQTLIAGGVAFDIPEGREREGPAEERSEFRLYGDQESTREVVFEHSIEFIAEFGQSVRGLVVGAPVEYRGLTVGKVEGILFNAVDRTQASNSKIPVLISIQPARLGASDDPAGVERMRVSLPKNVTVGLRATLETGNLITGSLFVSMDYFPAEVPTTVGEWNGYMTIPTIATGLEGLGRKVSSIMTKVNDLPIDQTIDELNGTLRELRTLVASKEVEELPANVNESLSELSRTLESFAPGSPVYDQLDRAVAELTRALQSVENVSRTLNEQPNSLIFDKPIEPDPEPRGTQ
jgi:paraquat-inducible protein B